MKTIGIIVNPVQLMNGFKALNLRFKLIDFIFFLVRLEGLSFAFLYLDFFSLKGLITGRYMKE